MSGWYVGSGKVKKKKKTELHSTPTECFHTGPSFTRSKASIIKSDGATFLYMKDWSCFDQEIDHVGKDNAKRSHHTQKDKAGDVNQSSIRTNISCQLTMNEWKSVFLHI